MRGGGFEAGSAGKARSLRGGGGGGALDRGGGGSVGQEKGGDGGKEGGLLSGHGADSSPSPDSNASASNPGSVGNAGCCIVPNRSWTLLVSNGSAGVVVGPVENAELVSNGSDRWSAEVENGSAADAENGSEPNGSGLADAPVSEEFRAGSAAAWKGSGVRRTLNGPCTWLVSNGSAATGAGELGASRRLGGALVEEEEEEGGGGGAAAGGPRLGTAGGCSTAVVAAGSSPVPVRRLGRAPGTAGGVLPLSPRSPSTAGNTVTPPAGAEGASLLGRGRGWGSGPPPPPPLPLLSPFSPAWSSRLSELRVRGVGVGAGRRAGGGGSGSVPPSLALLPSPSSMSWVVRLLGSGLGAWLFRSSSPPKA